MIMRWMKDNAWMYRIPYYTNKDDMKYASPPFPVMHVCVTGIGLCKLSPWIKYAHYLKVSALTESDLQYKVLIYKK